MVPQRFRKVPQGSANLAFKSGFLIKETDHGPRRLVDSLAAVRVAEVLKDQLAWDAKAGAWMTWHDTHWEPGLTSENADQLLAQALHEGTHPLGFRASYLGGVVQIIQKRALLRRADNLAGIVSQHVV